MFETAYSYLWAAIFVTLAAAVLLALLPRQRTPMLISGATSASVAWCGFTLEGVYWSPSRIGGGAFGVEDLLIAFAVGVGAWSLAASPDYFSLRTLSWHRRVAVWRLGGCLISGVVGFLGLWLAGFPAMSLYIGCLGTGAVGVLVWRTALWPIAMSGALGFALVWFLISTVYFLVWPGSVLQWNASSVWGRPCMGVPLGELAWAATFGAAWPLFTAFVLDARFSDP